MPSFGAASLKQLGTCHPDLQRLFLDVIEAWDCQVLEGKRTETQQKINVAKGVSKTMQSKHVYPLNGPSLAVDVAPYPVKWPKRPALDIPDGLLAKELARWAKDMGRLYYFSGYVLGIAHRLGIPIRHGADWDGDRDIHEQAFDDLPHFELLGE